MRVRLAAGLAFSLLLAGRNYAETNRSGIDKAAVVAAEKLFGLDFSDAKIEMMLPGLRSQLEDYVAIRSFPLSNSVLPAVQFNPIPIGFQWTHGNSKFRAEIPRRVELPANREELAFYSVAELASLIRARKISSAELTRFYLDRLKKYGPRLECVVTLTEERALREARRADQELAKGKYRGPLHGIPYGAKDLLAAEGIPTTWGAAPYTNQVFGADAMVIHKLEEAGAVLIAKTTLGELAMGGTWFGGMTRNPWKVKESSSGSSAGSSAGTAAGLMAFAIGTETYGSIVSPCDRCGAVGLRPTYGRVSRVGAMTLSWSMDKIGPICRTVDDCATVFNAIYGPDKADPTLYQAPFSYPPKFSWKKARVGYLKADFESQKGERKSADDAALAKIEDLGAKLIPVTLPDYPISRISFLLSTEGATAFDDLTRSGKEDWLKQQDSGSWPNTFRRRQFVPAVEYLQAQRIRWLLIQDMAKVFEKVDFFIAPSQAGNSSLMSNLTGHPSVVLPNGFRTNNTPMAFCFIGKLFGEAEILTAAKEYQKATPWHLRHPQLDNAR